MKKTTRNYLLDTVMGILGILLAISSFLLWVVFPRGYHATRALWIDIHKWGGLALSVLAVIHLIPDFPAKFLQYLARKALANRIVRQQAGRFLWTGYVKVKSIFVNVGFHSERSSLSLALNKLCDIAEQGQLKDSRFGLNHCCLFGQLDFQLDTPFRGLSEQGISDFFQGLVSINDSPGFIHAVAKPTEMPSQRGRFTNVLVDRLKTLEEWFHVQMLTPIAFEEPDNPAKSLLFLHVL